MLILISIPMPKFLNELLHKTTILNVMLCYRVHNLLDNVSKYIVTNLLCNWTPSLKVFEGTFNSTVFFFTQVHGAYSYFFFSLWKAWTNFLLQISQTNFERYFSYFSEDLTPPLMSRNIRIPHAREGSSKSTSWKSCKILKILKRFRIFSFEI